MPLAIDLSDLPSDVLNSLHKVLTDEFAVELMQAKIRQKRIAQFYHNNSPRMLEGMGAQAMSVDPFWIGYFNMLHGRQVWADPDFSKWIQKQTEMFTVKSQSGKVQVGYSPVSRKYRNTYPSENANN
jgi:hypothetical protein